MKQPFLYIIFLIFTLIICSCEKSQVNKEWLAVKDTKDFAEFFNFGLSCQDSVLLEYCYDSLTKYIPSECCTILFSGEYYIPNIEDSANQRFRLIDECDWEFDMKERNILFFRIDSLDNIESHYKHKRMNSYKEFILDIYTSQLDSYDLPEIELIQIDDSMHFTRHLVIFIYTEMLWTTHLTTSWGALYDIIRELTNTYDKIKEIKSRSIYDAPYKDISKLQQKKIDLLSSKDIAIHFCIYRIPPKPPPPNSL